MIDITAAKEDGNDIEDANECYGCLHCQYIVSILLS